MTRSEGIATQSQGGGGIPFLFCRISKRAGATWLNHGKTIGVRKTVQRMLLKFDV